MMNILLLSGSFRPESFNNTLLEHTKGLLDAHNILQYPIEELPFYSDALYENQPDSVKNFLEQVTQADAIIIASPEFNHSIPAVLKNAIDWASRPAFSSPLKHKPVTVMSASPSPIGGIHAQVHLKHILDSTLSVIYPAVSFSVASAHEKMRDGQLIDETSIRRLERHINGFLQWISKQ